LNGQIDRSSMPTAAHPAHRGSICLEEGRVLGQHAFQGEQYVLRIEAPRCAARAQPGSFVHLTVDDDIPMRRPLSIMRADAREGWIDILYKVVGPGLAALSRRRTGARVTLSLSSAPKPSATLSPGATSPIRPGSNSCANTTIAENADEKISPMITLRITVQVKSA
jgi:hypothetical protein